MDSEIVTEVIADVVHDIISGEPVPELSEPQTFAGKLAAAANAHPPNPDPLPVPSSPFDGPFDAGQAWAAVSRINSAYQDAIKEHERLAKLTKAARETREKLGKELSELIEEYNGRKPDAPQPFLKAVDEETIHERRQRLVDALRGREVFVTGIDLEALDRTELDAIEHWLTHVNGDAAPEAIMRRAHVANGSDDPACARCGLGLVAEIDGTPIHEGMLVWLSCPGEGVPAPKKRGRKRKTTPEAEAAAQIEDAQQRGDDDPNA